MDPFPTFGVLHYSGIAIVAQVLLVSLFLGGSWFALTQSGTREMVLFLVVLVCFYAFAAPGVRFYWYGVPVSLLFYPIVMLGAFHLSRAAFSRISLHGIPLENFLWGASCCVLTLVLLGTLIVQSRNLKLASQWEEHTREALGIMFASQIPPDSKIMLEPIGYIGFYSNRYVYDLAGLVSPAIVNLRKQYPLDWYSRAIFSLAPDFLVLRKFEIEQNECFVGGGRLFQSEEDKSRFFLLYHKIQEFQGLASHPSDAQFLVVFQKTATIGTGHHN
jgi:hypothetical protein